MASEAADVADVADAGDDDDGDAVAGVDVGAGCAGEKR